MDFKDKISSNDGQGDYPMDFYSVSDLPFDIAVTSGLTIVYYRTTH